MTGIVSGDKLQTSNGISAIWYFDGMTMKHNMSASAFIKHNIFDIISSSFFLFSKLCFFYLMKNTTCGGKGGFLCSYCLGISKSQLSFLGSLTLRFPKLVWAVWDYLVQERQIQVGLCAAVLLFSHFFGPQSVKSCGKNGQNNDNSLGWTPMI